MMPRTYDFAEKVLFTEVELQVRIKKIAARIANDYKDKGLHPFTNPLVLICVLKGSFMFTTDLCRALSDYNVPVRMEFICVSSYGSAVTTSGQVRMLLDTRHSIEGRHVMIVEDIVDSALTLSYLFAMYAARKPKSLKTVVLLDKREGRKVPFVPHYAVANVPNFFVVGYGLDYDDAYRELRDVVILHPDVYKAREEARERERLEENKDRQTGSGKCKLKSHY